MNDDQPAMPSDTTFRGNAVTRVEDGRFVTGTGRYVGDISPPGLLHAAFVRSTFPHGVLGDIDVSIAEDMPGVVGVWTHATIGIADLPVYGPVAVDDMERPVLATGRVRHTGEAIAVVVAESAVAAADAAGSPGPIYRPLSHD